MSTARRARGRGHGDDSHDEPDEPDERWAVSYADMVTVLMCLFIVLFAISNVDATKFELLANSLASGFGQEETHAGGADTAEGVVVPPEMQDDDGVVDLTAPADLTERANAEYESLEQLKERMLAALTVQGLQNTVEFVIDDRGLSVGLIGAETFFGDNSTDLSGTADAVLDSIGDVLGTVDNQVSIEGHADHRVSAYPFPTNWELSGGRATQVARFLVEHEGIAGPRVKATAYSDTRPIAQGDSPEALASNRRVDIVVESNEEEQVRALIPAIVQGAAAK